MTRTVWLNTGLAFAALVATGCSSIQQAWAENGTNVEVRSSMPVACQADIVSSQLITITPLAINATVHQSCNATHDLSVVFGAASVSAPSKLIITFDGVLPNLKLSNAQVFVNLLPTDAVKPVTIRYNAGTLAQRQELARTWGITVAH